MNRRMSDGIQFTVAYTFAKTTDWFRGNLNPVQTVAIPE